MYRFISIHNMVHEVIDPNINAAITLLTIQHLRALLINFLTQVIHRAIVAQKLDMSLKRGSKIWKNAKEPLVGASPRWRLFVLLTQGWW